MAASSSGLRNSNSTSGSFCSSAMRVASSEVASSVVGWSGASTMHGGRVVSAGPAEARVVGGGSARRRRNMAQGGGRGRGGGVCRLPPAGAGFGGGGGPRGGGNRQGGGVGGRGGGGRGGANVAD